MKLNQCPLCGGKVKKDISGLELGSDGFMYWRGKKLSMTRRTSEYLEVLRSHLGHPVRTDRLFYAVHGTGSEATIHNVTVHIRSIRNNLPKVFKLRNIWGTGYILELKDD